MSTALEKIKTVTPKWRTRYAKNNPEVLLELDALYPGVPLSIQIESYVRGSSPYCEVCNAVVKLARNTTCSRRCNDIKNKDPDRQSARLAKQKQTMMEKYGVENAALIPGMSGRKKETMMEKYGGLSSPKSREAARQRADALNAKGKETLMLRHGVANPGQLANHRDKCRETLTKNYGVDHYSMSAAAKSDREGRRHEKWNSLDASVLVSGVVAPADTITQHCPFANYRVQYTCTNCGLEEILPSETFKWRVQHMSTACRNCSGVKIGSRKQLELASYITSLGHAVTNNYSLPSGKQIDIYVQALNIGVEFNGLYWHSEENGITRGYHVGKTEEAAKQGINLIHIFEDEWDNKRNIVESLLKVRLNNVLTKVSARKCVIKEVNTSEEKDFLERNHISGWARSSIKIGLYYSNSLVMIMTFGRPNRTKGQIRKTQHEYELLRMCSAIDTVVVGGAAKLFKHFINTYHVERIHCFSDRRWGNGNVYRQIGFEFVGNTRENYWYADLKNGRRLQRWAHRKTAADVQSLTEHQNRRAQGLLRIWDCGSSKWVWEKQKET
jgi:hypothetical protein